MQTFMAVGDVVSDIKYFEANDKMKNDSSAFFLLSIKDNQVKGNKAIIMKCVGFGRIADYMNSQVSKDIRVNVVGKISISSSNECFILVKQISIVGVSTVDWKNNNHDTNIDLSLINDIEMG